MPEQEEKRRAGGWGVGRGAHKGLEQRPLRIILWQAQQLSEGQRESWGVGGRTWTAE